jgi:hypothetical protein
VPQLQSFVFQIFIGVITLKACSRAQMNTNSDMLPVSTALVHTGKLAEHDINAQKCSKMPPVSAKCRGGLNWY